jgi:UDP-N-acetylglucosamine--N-acetylmuramyl-(pentapeptide) pyrophosphoryl-undecaprenol N-acetylglucosamine transferase
MPRILITCGGSGGHIAPALSVWEALRSFDPKSAFLFLCTEKESDAEFLRHSGAPFRAIPTPRFSWKGTATLIRAWRISKKTIEEFQPDVLFCKGGAVSLVPALVAKLLGIPIVLHESDVTMGRANRLLAMLATRVCLGWALPMRSTAMKRSGKYHVTGNPVRNFIRKGKREDGLRRTGFSGKRPILLITGGSQGSIAINKAICSLLPNLLQHFDIVHITGVGKSGCARQKGYYTMPFAHEDLADLYAIATVAVSRSGAGAIAELAANGIPTILVPLRGLAQDHQQKNAQCAAHIGGCTVLQQEVLVDRLAEALHAIVKPHEHYVLLQRKIQNLALPTADRQIAKNILQSVAKPTSTA